MGKPATATEIAKVTKATDSLSAGWAFAQWDLRKRAKVKFKNAQEMLFGKEALEQATHEAVALYHASLFPLGALVADLTTGIGADLIALLKRGPAVGYEIDAERALMARHNVEIHGLIPHVNEWDCLSAAWEFQYAFADPARRVAGRRTLNIEEFEPDPDQIVERFRDLNLGVMKLTPLLADDLLTTLGRRLEFISYGKECREVLAISGREVVPGRFAIHLESGEALMSGEGAVSTSEPGSFLYDVDPAAIRAHCVGNLARQWNLTPLGESVGYLTGGTLAVSPWLHRYKVVYAGRGDLKATRLAIRNLGGKVYEVKQRGVGADPANLMKQLSNEGKLPLSLVLWPDGRSVRHLLACAEN